MFSTVIGNFTLLEPILIGKPLVHFGCQYKTCRTRAASRPAGYKHVRAIGDDVQSLNKIEIPKNKNFQNFQIFTPRGPYWYTGKRKIIDFLLLRRYNKNQSKISCTKSHIFDSRCSYGAKKELQWSPGPPKNEPQIAQRAHRCPGAEPQMAQRRAEISFSALRTSYRTNLGAFSS